MKIVIVDDRPYFMWEAIGKLRDIGVNEIVLLYFHGTYTYRSEKDYEIEQKCTELNVKLSHIKTNLEFRKQLNAYYEDKDTIFFVEYNLGDKTEFEDRIDIIYAKEKKQKGDFRIWFYTTQGEQIIDRLNRTFDDHTIPTVQFIPQKYILKLDYNYIQNKILSGNP